jgi:hypothetical protein
MSEMNFFVFLLLLLRAKFDLRCGASGEPIRSSQQFPDFEKRVPIFEQNVKFRNENRHGGSKKKRCFWMKSFELFVQIEMLLEFFNMNVVIETVNWSEVALIVAEIAIDKQREILCEIVGSCGKEVHDKKSGDVCFD